MNLLSAVVVTCWEYLYILYSLKTSWVVDIELILSWFLERVVDDGDESAMMKSPLIDSECFNESSSLASTDCQRTSPTRVSKGSFTPDPASYGAVPCRVRCDSTLTSAVNLRHHTRIYTIHQHSAFALCVLLHESTERELGNDAEKEEEKEPIIITLKVLSNLSYRIRCGMVPYVSNPVWKNLKSATLKRTDKKTPKQLKEGKLETGLHIEAVTVILVMWRARGARVNACRHGMDLPATFWELKVEIFGQSEYCKTNGILRFLIVYVG